MPTLRLIVLAGAALALGLVARAADHADLDPRLPSSYFPRSPGTVRYWQGSETYFDSIVLREVSVVMTYVGDEPAEAGVEKKVHDAMVVSQAGEQYPGECDWFYRVDDAQVRLQAFQLEGDSDRSEVEYGGEIELLGPLDLGATWTTRTSEMFTILGDEEIAGLRSECTVVGVDQTVEVGAGVFAGCLVTRSTGIAEGVHEVLGLIGGDRCAATVEHSVERTWARGIGCIRVVKRQTAVPVGYPDSVFASTVYRSEVVRVEHE